MGEAEKELEGSGIVKVLERCASAVRLRHPEIPRPVISITIDAGNYWGLFSQSVWEMDGRRAPAIVLARQGLTRPAEEVFATLIHECTHGLCAARGVDETSRQGRYHNKKFKAAAEELGLECTMGPQHGYHVTTWTPTLDERYGDTLDALREVLAHLNLAPPAGKVEGTGKKRVFLQCACDPPRELKLLFNFYAEAPLLCGRCDEPFLSKKDAQKLGRGGPG